MDKGKKDKILFKEHKNYLGFLLILSYKAIFIWKYIDWYWVSRELSLKSHFIFIF